MVFKIDNTPWTDSDISAWGKMNNKNLSDTPSTCVSGPANNPGGAVNSASVTNKYLSEQKKTSQLNNQTGGEIQKLKTYHTNAPVCKAGYRHVYIGKGVGASHNIGLASNQGDLAALAGTSGGGRKKIKYYKNKRKSHKNKRKSHKIKRKSPKKRRKSHKISRKYKRTGKRKQ